MIHALDPNLVKYIQNYILKNKKAHEFTKSRNYNELLSYYISLEEKLNVAADYILRLHTDNIQLAEEVRQLQEFKQLD